MGGGGKEWQKGTLKAGRGHFWVGRTELEEDWAWEGVGSVRPHHILTPTPGTGSPTWASQICVSYMVGADPRSPIGLAGALLRVKGKKIL